MQNRECKMKNRVGVGLARPVCFGGTRSVVSPNRPTAPRGWQSHRAVEHLQIYPSSLILHKYLTSSTVSVTAPKSSSTLPRSR
jgi:hypothetical protein